MIQLLQINKCDILHRQNKEYKSYDHFNLIISTDAEKAFEKVKNSFIIKKTLNKLYIEGMCLNIIKTCCEKSTATLYSIVKRKAFSLKIETRQ